MITLFDIPSSAPQRAWSLHAWKARLCLNYKQLPHKTHWLDYPDIEPTLKSHDIGPTGTKPRDGSPEYTIPAILDVNENGTVKKAVADSFEIVKYLDVAYPETKRVIPEGKEEEQYEKAQELCAHLRTFLVLLFKAILGIVNERNREHSNKARAGDLYHLYGKDTLDEIEVSVAEKERLWGIAKESFDKLDAALGKEGKKGPWYLGEDLSFVDLAIGAFLICFVKAFGEDSDEWRDISSWNNGRWARFVQNLQPFMSVN